jgi:hypothetical protein
MCSMLPIARRLMRNRQATHAARLSASSKKTQAIEDSIALALVRFS